jgi:POT family proton-dependent oligopeptide transporter
LGGVIADKWNFQKTVALGIGVMFLGYLCMAIPTAPRLNSSLVIMLAALLLISLGTGLFKGNLQVMIGDLYNAPQYSSQRDTGFSLFYMAINIGAMFAPATSEALCNFALHSKGLLYDPALPSICNAFIAGDTISPDSMALLQTMSNGATDLMAWCEHYMETISIGYSYAFGVACVSLIVSYLIYRIGQRTYDGVSDNKKKVSKDGGKEVVVDDLTPEQTKSRIVALLLVFLVVIFFWMVFSQNGATLTLFAQVFTQTESSSWTRIGFNVWALAVIVVAVYAAFSLIQSKGKTSRLISGLVLLVALIGLGVIYHNTPESVGDIQPQIYQQFNPFYVVALTPFSVALFGWLAKKGKEPSAPRKIGLGMIVAACAFLIMCLGSIGLGVAPTEGVGSTLVSPNLLIGAYLVLTFAELLLSPMGCSFVSKVAPPKYKGAMMGCWFGATAIGNYLVSIPTLIWNSIDVAVLWAILIVVCLISACFIFAIMKKLEAATQDA